MSLHFIFLMQAEEAAFFESLLCGTEGNIGTCAETLEQLEALAGRLPRPRLIAFSTDVIVPGAVIQALAGDCFNFHSGPPERPGYRPFAFALSKGERDFGVTFHQMVRQVDAGPIYAVRRFPLEPARTEQEASVIVYQQMLALAVVLQPHLVRRPLDLQPSGHRWGAARTTRRQYLELVRRPQEPRPAC